MKTKLVAMITAGAIAVTSLGAVPVQADPADDLARLLFGAAVIGIIVHEANKNKQPAVVTRNNHKKHKKIHRQNKRKHAGHSHKKPRQCLRNRQRPNGTWRTVYGRKCMLNRGWHLGQNGWYMPRHAHNH